MNKLIFLALTALLTLSSCSKDSIEQPQEQADFQLQQEVAKEYVLQINHGTETVYLKVGFDTGIPFNENYRGPYPSAPLCTGLHGLVIYEWNGTWYWYDDISHDPLPSEEFAHEMCSIWGIDY